MSNSLIISVVSLTAIGADNSTSVGFLASDGEGGQLWEDNWPSLDAFHEQFPTRDALVEYVMSQRDEWTDYEGHVRVEWA